MVKTSMFMLAFFAMTILAFSMVSANLDIINTTNTHATITQGDSVSFKFRVNNTEPSDALLVSFSNVTTGDIKVSLPSSQLISNLSGELTLTVDTTYWTTKGENYQVTLTVANETFSDNMVFKINVTESIEHMICGDKYASENISIGDIEDDEKGNEDEWEWRPSNEISITVNNIENKVDDDEKFDVSLLFYKNGVKVSGSKIVTDDDDLKIDNLKIDGDDDADTTFEFKVAGDVDADDYNMYVKVDGKYGCYVKKLSDTISIEKEDDDYSIVTGVTGSNTAECGESVDLIVDVANIGDDDADRVKVVVYNKELGINEYKEISDLNEGDEDSVTFSLKIPSDAVAKTYKLLFYTQFDYDDDDNTYGEYSDDEYDYTYAVAVLGNCVDATKPTITANLETDAVVGEEMVISVTFQNNANTSMSAIIAPEDYEAWADLVSVEPATINVGKSDSETVYITLNPKTEGQKTFNINVIYMGKSLDQPITVSVSESGSLMNTLKDKFGNVGAYLIVGIIVLIALIVLILIIKAVIWLFRR